MRKFLKNNWFLFAMILGILLGCLTGYLSPATTLSLSDTDEAGLGIEIALKSDGSYKITQNVAGDTVGAEVNGLQKGEWEKVSDTEILLTKTYSEKADDAVDAVTARTWEYEIAEEGGEGTVSLSPAAEDSITLTLTDGKWSCEITDSETGKVYHPVSAAAALPVKGATVLSPLGTLFINMMFCVVVPMVFFSISSAIANMKSTKRAGKLMGTTVVTFICTTVIASVIMYIVVKLTGGVYTGKALYSAESGSKMGVGELIVGFFTKADFPELWSRRSILQLIIAGIFFGFGVQMCGGPKTKIAPLLEEITNALLKVIKLITFYAPIGFFGFFADLVATHGADFMGQYGKAVGIYYIVAFAYMFLIFPLYARFGGGKGAVKVMFQHLFRPAAVAFGTCSSVATIPTNMEVSEDTGISKDVTDIVLPMGATMNMDGSGMSAIIKVAFLFPVFGMKFGTGDALLAIVVATLSSVAMSGIPGGGGTGELVLCSLFFPPELMPIAFPMALAIGDLVDPPATMVNAAGDYVASFIVSRFNDGKDWLQKKLRADAKKQ